MGNKCYSELSTLPTFEDRFKYLQMNGQVGLDTFGHARYLNQNFYKSAHWKRVRDYVIVRDNGCDLGCPDRPISGQVYVHHIVPIVPEDIINNNIEKLLSPENLISVSLETHNALHYGDESILHKYDTHERRPGDTCPWKEKNYG